MLDSDASPFTARKLDIVYIYLISLRDYSYGKIILFVCIFISGFVSKTTSGTQEGIDTRSSVKSFVNE